MRKLTLFVIPALTLAACGGDDGASLPIDAPGGNIDAPPAACTVSTLHGPDAQTACITSCSRGLSEGAGRERRAGMM